MVDQAADGYFTTLEGVPIPALTARQMKMVDDLAENRFRLSVLQMMENAGRDLAQLIWPRLDMDQDSVVVLAGSGGNGGGGLAAARHLHNHGVKVHLILSRDETKLSGPAEAQMAVVKQAGLKALPDSAIEGAIARSKVVIDALIGYSLQGAPRGRSRELIEICNQKAGFIISLDVPSGLDATSGERPGLSVSPQQVITLALPKTGLASVGGEMFLADIGIPPALYRHLDLDVGCLFKGEYILPIKHT
ncbi:MAG: NAD(P)H-hydrate epimerase [Anaerolineales bacterium]|jgi:NAD(P)H-hydrate epimerase